jgi:DNA polymerase-1
MGIRRQQLLPGFEADPAKSAAPDTAGPDALPTVPAQPSSSLPSASSTASDRDVPGASGSERKIPRQTVVQDAEADPAALPDPQASPAIQPTSTASDPNRLTLEEARSWEHRATAQQDLSHATVYVVDAHSLIYQVFYAYPPMSGPTGQPVGATYGFLRDILQLLEKQKPDYLLCAFDHPSGETFRHNLYTEYKAQRESMPQDLQPQIGQIQRLLDALRIPVYQVPNYEADDVLATVARQTEQAGGTCYLVTADKDCRQLIGDRVFVWDIRKGTTLDRDGLHAIWGVRPEQVVDFQALVGDAVDQVPGVPLIGPKIAQELLEQFQTLEGIQDHLDDVRGTKRRENLRTHREQALLSRQLVRLVDDLPLEIDWAAARVGQMDVEAADSLCREFGFRKVMDRIRELAGAAAPASAPAPSTASSAAYRLIATTAELHALVSELLQQQRIVIDTETTSTSPRWAELVGLSFSWQAGQGCYIPVRAPRDEPQLDRQTVLEALRPVLENPAIAKIGQNIKYDVIVLRAAGIQVQGIAFDTMVADYLLDAGARNHNLDDLAYRYLHYQTIPISDLIGKGKKQKRMDEVPLALVVPYAAEDADIPLRLTEQLAPKLHESGLDTLFKELELPLIEVLAEMEFNGIRVDVPTLEKLSRRYGTRMAELKQEIDQLAGQSFNIDSPKQLAQILFEHLQLPIVRRTKTGPSTDAEVLQQLAALHDLPARVLAYRQYGKLKSTYVDALPALVHPQTGRVHTSFKQDVAATGRLSSSEPNLQNIPIRTDEGREIRAAFRAGEPGWFLLAADYSQIELRVLAHFSADEALLRAFAEDRDIHSQVASEVYGVPLEDVDKTMRRNAKAVNFGVIYGQSPFGLAQSLGISQAEAETFIETYFQRFRGVEAFLRQILADCRKNEFVTTILGRRRAISGVRNPESTGRSHQRTLPERIAINTVIQGSAADLIKMAMVRLHQRLKKSSLRARMLLQIHDELVFEFPPEEQATLLDWVRQEMTSVGNLAVPLRVDMQVGTNWAECE